MANTGMYFCFKQRFFTGHVGLISVLAGTLCAGTVSDEAPRVRSVVRADSHGRLIRTVVVLPPLVEPKASASASDAVSVPELIEEAAKRHDVDPLLIHSVIQVESNYNPYAVSHKGAQGLMQLMPATARRFGVRNTFNVKENIEGGVRYLKYLDSLFPNDKLLTIAAYNAGEGAVWKYGKKIPPYRETTQYVQRVGTRYGKARQAAQQKKVASPQPVETAQSLEPEVKYNPIQAFVDSEGRLHLRTTPVGPAEQNP